MLYHISFEKKEKSADNMPRKWIFFKEISGMNGVVRELARIHVVTSTEEEVRSRNLKHQLFETSSLPEGGQ